MLKRLLFSLLATASLSSLSAYMGEPSPSHMSNPPCAEVRGYYTGVTRASFKDGETPSSEKFRYSEAGASAKAFQATSSKTNLSVSVGYRQVNISWPQNPATNQTYFNSIPVGFFMESNAIKNWNFRGLFIACFDTKANNLSVGQTTFYMGGLTGRYQYNDDVGIYIGVLGFGGIRRQFAIPMIGFDWRISKDWSLLVLPYDINVTYQWNEKLSFYTGMRPFYEVHRLHSWNTSFYQYGTFEYYSLGWEIGARYHIYKALNCLVYAGETFNTYMKFTNQGNTNGVLYRNKSAPYFGAALSVSF